jgi:hypothetical protein
MFGALLILLAVTAPAAAAPQHCVGLHCGLSQAPASDTRYGGENLDAQHDSRGLDPRSRTSSGIDRSFDNRHDSNFDREGFDASGIWPAH